VRRPGCGGRASGGRAEAAGVLRAAAADKRVLTGAADKRVLTGAAERLPEFKHPALVVWASQDRVMPPEHGRRLAGLLPEARLAEVTDSYTLIPLDQPARFAQIIREWLGTAR
jgi:pimeloyl-ACP methyl ester carboxylesterase